MEQKYAFIEDEYDHFERDYEYEGEEEPDSFLDSSDMNEPMAA